MCCTVICSLTMERPPGGAAVNITLKLPTFIADANYCLVEMLSLLSSIEKKRHTPLHKSKFYRSIVSEGVSVLLPAITWVLQVLLLSSIPLFPPFIFLFITLLSPSELLTAEHSVQSCYSQLTDTNPAVCAFCMCVCVCLWWLICINGVRRTTIKSWETVSSAALSCDY